MRGHAAFDDLDPREYTAMTMPPVNGTKRKRAKAAPKRRQERLTRAQLAAGRRFLAESPVKPTAEGMAAIERELQSE